MKRLIILLPILLAACGAAPMDGFDDASQEIDFAAATSPQQVISGCDEQADNLASAVEFWNNVAGRDVFIIAENHGFPVYCMDSLRFNVGISSQNPEAHTCNYIFVNPLLDERGLIHELGHCLGLDHSQDPSSVMHSPAGDTVSEQIYNHVK